MNTINNNRKLRYKKRVRAVVLKKKIILTCAVVSLLFTAVFISMRFVNVNATNNSTNPVYKYFTSYEIQPGDTLTSIAQKYTVNSDISVSEYIKEVKKNNNLSTDKITSGKYIVVSYYSNEYK